MIKKWKYENKKDEKKKYEKKMNEKEANASKCGKIRKTRLNRIGERKNK